MRGCRVAHSSEFNLGRMTIASVSTNRLKIQVKEKNLSNFRATLLHEMTLLYRHMNYLAFRKIINNAYFKNIKIKVYELLCQKLIRFSASFVVVFIK